MTEILKVKDLRISFFTHVGEVKAIRGINFSVEKGQIVGIVGESGSGKSVTSLSVMGLRAARSCSKEKICSKNQKETW